MARVGSTSKTQFLAVTLSELGATELRLAGVSETAVRVRMLSEAEDRLVLPEPLNDRLWRFLLGRLHEPPNTGPLLRVRLEEVLWFATGDDIDSRVGALIHDLRALQRTMVVLKPPMEKTNAFILVQSFVVDPPGRALPDSASMLTIRVADFLSP